MFQMPDSDQTQRPQLPGYVSSNFLDKLTSVSRSTMVDYLRTSQDDAFSVASGQQKLIISQMEVGTYS